MIQNKRACFVLCFFCVFGLFSLVCFWVFLYQTNRASDCLKRLVSEVNIIARDVKLCAHCSFMHSLTNLWSAWCL